MIVEPVCRFKEHGLIRIYTVIMKCQGPIKYNRRELV